MVLGCWIKRIFIEPDDVTNALFCVSVSILALLTGLTFVDRTRNRERPRHLFDMDNPDDTWIAMIQSTYEPTASTR